MPQPADSAPRKVSLLCGFSPLYLETYLKAFTSLRFPGCRVSVETGLFGDVPGNLERAAAAGVTEAAVVLEWQDIDPRLGWRHAGGRGARAALEIPGDFGKSLDRILAALAKLAARAVIALSPPGLPLPGLGHFAPVQAGTLQLDLEFQLAGFLRQAAALPGVRVVSRHELDQVSAPGERLDLKLDLSAGFPYRTAHAAILAKTLVDLLFPNVPKKGIITDLDGVVWRGLVGEAGPEGVTWDLASHSQVHAIYQQTLAALADYGVLLAVASKNDPDLVRRAFERPDILIDPQRIFPFEVHWSAKSESVARILRAWNIAADSVVFIDDSPLELAEVQSRHPEIECLLFPPRNPEGVGQLTQRLQTLFGKPAIFEEDRIRASSIRSASIAPPLPNVGANPDFLAGARATITFDMRRDPRDARPLELINKTNQFNLNGRRWTEAEWRGRMDAPDAFTLVVSYEDKFGPLGKIAALSGKVCNSTVSLDAWVISCRAFSRLIEDHTLDYIFSSLGASEVILDYLPTDRNRPVCEFFERMKCDAALSPVRISRDIFALAVGVLPHSTKVIS